MRIKPLAAIATVSLIGLWALWGLDREKAPDGYSATEIAAGRDLYSEYCAACHGAQLEGQPDWQSPLSSGRLPAPPHDASGHTWHHSDALLFRLVKDGTAAVIGEGYESDMPGFGAVLADNEIRAILTFIKSTWPEHERTWQAERSRTDGG